MTEAPTSSSIKIHRKLQYIIWTEPLTRNCNSSRLFLCLACSWWGLQRSYCSHSHLVFNLRLLEYDVEPCSYSGLDNDICVHSKKSSFIMPKGGYVVYGVAHQHSGGNGSALYGVDGRLICSSMPIYGEGEEAGNEDGYVVGMSTCYPQPGSVKLSGRETLLLVSNYSSAQKHTGVMGLFYILIAEQVVVPANQLGTDFSSNPQPLLVQVLHMLHTMNTKLAAGATFILGIVIIAAVVVLYKRSRDDKGGYSPIMS